MPLHGRHSQRRPARLCATTGVPARHERLIAIAPRSGQFIGANDLLIAAHARSLDLVLVTSNTAQFSRITDLKLENWTQPR